MELRAHSAFYAVLQTRGQGVGKPPIAIKKIAASANLTSAAG
ncbi:MAG TPA: hypothetical protein PLS11_15315 [Ottowia sp.]|nr:hypothetical protein [Ottowia sp.]